MIPVKRMFAFMASGAMLSAAFLSPATAHATPVQDAAFLSALSSVGITYASPTRVITGAYAVCASRAAGFSDMEVAAKVLANNDLTPYLAGFFVGAAEGAYCPELAAQPTPAANSGDFGPRKL